MEAWDVAYVSEKLLQARYAFSEQEVKQYFTEDKVLAGLFTVIETLFGVRLKPDRRRSGTTTCASSASRRPPAN
jgi:oligopeptidase A